MLDFQKWIEAEFGKWGWAELRRASLIFAVALIGLNAGIAWLGREPASSAASAQNAVIERWLPNNDPRGFSQLSDRDLARTSGAYDVAWISASDPLIQNAQPPWRLNGRSNFSLTEALGQSISAPMVVHQYLLPASRTGDMRRAVLNAASQPEIDAYIVAINPVWIFHDAFLFQLPSRSHQRASALSAHNRTLADILTTLAVARPSEIALELSGQISPLVRDRSRYLGHLQPADRADFPFRRYSPAGVRPWENAIRDWFYPAAGSPQNHLSPPMGRQRQLLLMSGTHQDSLGAELLLANMQTLAATGKPAIFYISPVNPSIRDDKALVDQLTAIAQLVRSLANEVTSPNLVVDTSTLWDTPQPLQHVDILHLSQGQGLVEHLLGLIERLSGRHFSRVDMSKGYGGNELR